MTRRQLIVRSAVRWAFFAAVFSLAVLFIVWAASDVPAPFIPMQLPTLETEVMR